MVENFTLDIDFNSSIFADNEKKQYTEQILEKFDIELNIVNDRQAFITGERESIMEFFREEYNWREDLIRDTYPELYYDIKQKSIIYSKTLGFKNLRDYCLHFQCTETNIVYNVVSFPDLKDLSEAPFLIDNKKGTNIHLQRSHSSKKNFEDTYEKVQVFPTLIKNDKDLIDFFSKVLDLIEKDKLKPSSEDIEFDIYLDSINKKKEKAIKKESSKKDSSKKDSSKKII